MQKSDFLFLLVLATIPIQLSKFIFFNYSYVLGLPIDYRALSIYLSDLVVALFLVVFTLENRSGFKKIFKIYKPYILSLLIFNLYLFASSIFFSTSLIASLVFNFKILILSAFAIAGAYIFSRGKIYKPAYQVIKFSLLWESTLMILEFIYQRSLNIWILGERSFDSSTPEIANTHLFGNLILRPYGTFPHPNVAAAFITTYSIILLSQTKHITKTQLLIIIFAVLAMLLTYSKTAIAVLAVFLLVSARKLSHKIYLLAGAVLASSVLIILVINSQIASIAERFLLLQSSLDISLINPLFGIGSNNFILQLSSYDLTSLAETRLLQPVHNVFFLILAENGILGLLFFALVLFSILKFINSKIKVVLFISLLIYMSFDHFLWTLHQGQMILFLTTAYIAGAKIDQSLQKRVPFLGGDGEIL